MEERAEQKRLEEFKRKIIEEERRKLLLEHAEKVFGYLPAELLRELEKEKSASK
jgi:hypothetical protein